MDMSGIAKGRIQKRIEALTTELKNLLVTVAQYQAAIGELEQLLQPESVRQPIEYIETENNAVTT